MKLNKIKKIAKLNSFSSEFSLQSAGVGHEPKKGNTPRRIVATLLAMTVLLSTTLFLSACGGTTPGNPAATNQQDSAQVQAQATTMLEEPEILYEKESMRPSILVDLIGYLPESEKVAIIEAPIIPGRFSLINKETGKAVYSGNVKVKECPEDGELLTGIIDFSDVTEEGTYYLEAELVGRSFDFEIKTGIYDSLFRSAFIDLLALKDDSEAEMLVSLEGDDSVKKDVSGGWITGKDKQKDVCEGCLAVQDLMLGLEFYPKAFGDDMGTKKSGNNIPDILDEIMYEAEWLMKMQNPETGGVYTSVSLQKVDLSEEYRLVIMGETTRATAYFCATMAKLSYIVKKYDSKFSVKCIEAANLSWKCLEANAGLVDKTQMFRAAVEMYRATGYKVYKNLIEDYLKANADKDYEERIALDGAITYMSSTRSTNKDYCTKLMEHYMSRTEDKSNSAKASRYLVESGDREENVLLRNMVELAVVNYIISNQEYTTIEENYIHYLCGRNPESVVCTGFNESPDAYAQFIFLAGKLAYMNR